MQFTPFKIGQVEIDFPVMLAPMAGYTDLAMRLICREYGSGLVMTEVVNAAAINYNSQRTFCMLASDKRERPVGAHIYGHEPEILTEAAVTIEKLQRFDFIDINCGCPVRKLVTKGNGAALMKSPELIGRIVSAVSGAVSLPVTVKTRLGLRPGEKNILEISQAVEENGGKAIFIHGRYASQKHTGEVDFDALAEVKQAGNIPVIGNGGINNADEIVDFINKTGVDGVLIARAALGNPWIFKCARNLEKYKKMENIFSLNEWRDVIIRHLKMLIELKEQECKYMRCDLSAEIIAIRCFRSHLSQYLRGFKGSVNFRRKLYELTTFDDVVKALNCVIEWQK